MCGRFVASDSPQEIGQLLHARVMDGLPHQSWNVKPTQDIAIVLDGSDGVRRLAPAYWSLVPRMSPTLKLDFPTFNARIETALTRSTFRASADGARALIPVTGYYEWKGQTPWYFRDPTGPLLLAGLYSWWRDPQARRPHRQTDQAGRTEQTGQNSQNSQNGSLFGSWRLTATILTRDAVGKAAAVHDRMPVIVPISMADSWLSHQVPGADILPQAQVVSENQEKRLAADPVGPLKGDGPHLIHPLNGHAASSSNRPVEGQPVIQQYLGDF
jgi:putative SOS response-associated peptidase YedK